MNKLPSFRDLFIKQLNAFTAVIVIFTYTILLDRGFECTCSPDLRHCGLYMALPVFIIFALMLYTDKMLWAIYRHSGASCHHCCRFYNPLVFRVLKAAVAGVLWVDFVLLDGDWFVCCVPRSPSQMELACKSKTELKPEEHKMIVQLRKESRVIGSFLLLGIIIVGIIMSMIRSSARCRKNLFYQLILEEERSVMEETLRKSAKSKLTERFEAKVNDGNWDQCHNVAKKLIEDLTKPVLSLPLLTPSPSSSQAPLRQPPQLQEPRSQREQLTMKTMSGPDPPSSSLEEV